MVAPSWADPLARQHLGELMPIQMVARGGDEACARAIEIDFMGQSTAAIHRWPIENSKNVGPFQIKQRRNPHWVPSRYAFLEHIAPEALQVTVVDGNDPQECPFETKAPMTSGGLGGDPTAPRQRFHCPSGGYRWVGVTIIDDQNYQPRQCIWVPPPRRGSLTLRFTQVPLGRKLVGHAGGPWLMVRDGVGPAIRLSAAINGRTLGERPLRDTDGWTAFDWDTLSFNETVGTVELTVTGSPDVDQRLCLTLDAR